MAALIQHRRGTAAQWAAANPVLNVGEIGIEIDSNRLKVGNGSTPWNTLSFPVDPELITKSDAASRFEPRTRVFLTDYGVTPSSSPLEIRTAFAQACAAASAVDGLAEVYIGPGVWTMSLDGTGTWDGSWATITKGIRIRGRSANTTTLKISDNAGDYQYLIGHPSVPISGFELSDITIDWNTVGNPAVNDLLGGPARNALRIVGSDVYITRCRFINADCTQTMYLKANDVTVEDCLWLNYGDSITEHDSSAIYIHGDGMRVLNNTFKSGGNRYGARTAIETHGSTQTVQGNKVYGFSKGGNLTGVFEQSTEGANWSDNQFMGVCTGIVLWSQVYVGSPPPGLQNIHILDNLITIDCEFWKLMPGGNGGGLNGVFITRTRDLPTRDVTIARNKIKFYNFTETAKASLNASDNRDGGIVWTTSLAGIQDNNVRIVDNEIDSPIASGIHVDNGNIGSTAKNFEISRNRVRNPGQGVSSGAFSSSFGSGIMVLGDVTDVEINNNYCYDDQTTRTMHRPIDTAAATTFTRVRALDNRFSVADASESTTVTVYAPAAADQRILVRHSVSTYATPSTGSFAPGSEILEVSTGALYRQVASSGVSNTWRRIRSSSAAPTVAPGAGLGPAGTASMGANSTDDSGTFTLVSDASGTATGTIATVTFATPRAIAPKVSVQSTSGAAQLKGVGVSSTTTGFSVAVGSSPTVSTSVVYNYIVVP